MHLNFNGLKNDPNWIIFTYVNKWKIKFSLFNVKQVEKMNYFGYYEIKGIEIKFHKKKLFDNLYPL
jgi:hypothetical protein